MKRPRKRTNFFLSHATLPPRFVAAWFSDPTIDVEITSETVRAWRKAGFFGPRAEQAEGRVRLTWPELFTACGSWSPKGLLKDLQRKPYPSEVVAVRLGIEHATVLDRFRKRKIPGGFKIGAYWYARASDFDAAQALIL
jgi:hypothetical protein